VKRERRMVVDSVVTTRVPNGAVEVELIDTKGRRLTLYFPRKRLAHDLRDQLAEVMMPTYMRLSQ
jgi:hypothetical protein